MTENLWERAKEALKRDADWFEREAKRAHASATNSPNLPAFADACRKDAANYTASATIIRRLLSDMGRVECVEGGLLCAALPESEAFVRGAIAGRPALLLLLPTTEAPE